MLHLTLNDLTPDQLIAVGVALGGSQGKVIPMNSDKFIEEVAAKVVRVVKTDDSYPAIESQSDDDAAESVRQDQKEADAPAPAPKRTRRSKEQIEADEKAALAAKKEAAAPAARKSARDMTDDDEPAPAPKGRAAQTAPVPNLMTQMMELSEELFEFYNEGDGEKVLTKMLKVFGVETLSDVAAGDRTAVIQTIREKIESLQND